MKDNLLETHVKVESAHNVALEFWLKFTVSPLL